ncbi:nitronate monooxygenase [Streptomyces massasporeus]
MVAAGGLDDGRGPAAALALGAQGAATGTRLHASTEMNIAEKWKNRIVAAEAHGTIRPAHGKGFMPPFSRLGGFPRSLRTPFIEEAEEHPERVQPAEVRVSTRHPWRTAGSVPEGSPASQAGCAASKSGSAGGENAGERTLVQRPSAGCRVRNRARHHGGRPATHAEKVA